MSDYKKIKAIRYPIGSGDYDAIELQIANRLGSKYGWEDFYRSVERKFFEIVQTQDGNNYLDFILSYTYGADCGEYAVAFPTTEAEQDEYFELYKETGLDIDKSKFVKVVYCWYNCCEPPEVYDTDFVKQFERL